jgi:hypothetical protein
MSVVEQLFSDDPVGEVIIEVPQGAIDGFATVITLDLDNDGRQGASDE